MSDSDNKDQGKNGSDEPKKKPANKALIFGIVAVILLVAGFTGWTYYKNAQKFEETDDAQIEGDVVQVAPEVSGRVVRLLVKDNQKVKRGELLLEIDPTDYDNRLEQAQTQLQSAEASVRQAQAQLALTERQATSAVTEGVSGVQTARADVVTSEAGVGSAREQLKSAQAGILNYRAGVKRLQNNVRVAQAELARTNADVQRYQLLYAKDEVSRQQLDVQLTQQRQNDARVRAAEREVQGALAQVLQQEAVAGQAAELIRQQQAQVEANRSKVEEARARLASAETVPERIGVAAAQVRVARAQVFQARAAVTLARQNRERCRLLARVDGTVARRSAQLGNYAAAGSPVMALVVSQRPWIIANYKETQLESVHPGTEVDVSVDTYPGKVFTGHVDSLQPGTGARFSLLPPENASGSFVKIVQRVPVKITLDQDPPAETPLRPGMNVVAKAHVK